MSSIEQISTKGVSLKFPTMISACQVRKSNLGETPSATFTEHI